MIQKAGAVIDPDIQAGTSLEFRPERGLLGRFAASS